MLEICAKFEIDDPRLQKSLHVSDRNIFPMMIYKK